MKLCHLLTSAAVATLALAPLAATGAAGAAPFNAHSTRYSDTTPDKKIIDTINISNVHLYRTTKGSFVAVVKYKNLAKRSATKWLVGFQDYNSVNKAAGAKGQVGEGVAVEYRIGPDGKTAAFGYDYNQFSPTPTKSTCKGFSATPNLTADTITFTISSACWTLNYDPAHTYTLSRLYTAGQWDPQITGYDDETGGYHSDQAAGDWAWSNDMFLAPRGATSVPRNPFLG